MESCIVRFEFLGETQDRFRRLYSISISPLLTEGVVYAPSPFKFLHVI